MAGEAVNGRRALGVLAGLLFVKSLLFALLVPPWLGNDEPNHFEYVLVMSGESPAEAQREILESLNRTDYWKRSGMLAPTGPVGSFGETDLKQHSEDFVGTRSALYYRLAAVPVRLFAPAATEHKLLAARMVSVALSLLAVWAIYLSALAVFGGNVPASLLAAALAGFHPQFSYLSGVVNSDVLMVLLFSLAFYWVARMVRDGDVSPENLLVLLALVGVSLLVKKHAVALLPIALFGIVCAARGAKSALKAVLLFAAFLAAGILLMEFMLTREAIKLVDRLGLALGFFFSGPDEWGSLTAPQWGRGFAIMFVTFWFTYGQMVFKQSIGFYVIYALCTGVAAVGLVIAHFQNARGAKDGTLSRQMVFAFLFTAVVVAMTVVTFFSPQWIERVSGRYLFYAIAPLAVLASCGAGAAANALKAPPFYAAYLMIAFNFIALFFYLAPLYG